MNNTATPCPKCGQHIDPACVCLCEAQPIDTATSGPTLREQLEAFGFDEWDTGGGCKALGRTFADGSHVLITDDDGTGLPEAGAEVLIGFYHPERESGGLCFRAKLEVF